MRTTIRVSELSLFQKCRRRTYLQYEMGYDKTNWTAGLGTVFHSMLHGYHLSGDTEGAMDEEAFEIYAELDPDQQKMVKDMWTTYVKEVEDEGYDVGQDTKLVELRREKQIPGTEIVLSGQADHVYVDMVTGAIVVQDTKTKDKFHRLSPRDFQAMCYLWLAYDMPGFEGEDLFAIEHNVVKRNKRTARAKPPYIDRPRHDVSRAEIEAFGHQLTYMAKGYSEAMSVANRMYQGYRSPLLYPYGTNDCAWSCPFYDICGMIDEPDSDVESVLQMEFIKREEEPHAT